jgi:hypothetical protein
MVSKLGRMQGYNTMDDTYSVSITSVSDLKAGDSRAYIGHK